MISPSALVTVLDSWASGALIFQDAIGLDGTGTNTVSKAAANDIATVIADGDPAALADLLPALQQRAALTIVGALWRALGIYHGWQAMEGDTGGLAAFMAANNLRASALVRSLGVPLPPAQIMPPAVNPMATFAVVGSGSGIYTHVADIDTTQYGPAWLALVATDDIGGADVVVTVKGSQLGGAGVSQSATLPAASPGGTTVNLGTLGTLVDSFVAVTSVTITGGTAGDAFRVVSRVERVISPVS